LAVAIARLSGNVACTIGAEMLQPDGDGALPFKEAVRYGQERGIPIISGADLLAAMDKQ
jgi:3,4-dihydroxy-2-butanone 4-phosphate synthase